MKHEFSKPYTFEEVEYKELEIPLDELTGRKVLAIQKAWKSKGNYDPMINSNHEYCLELAASASGQPIEFFLDLPANEMSKLAQSVSIFLMA